MRDCGTPRLCGVPGCPRGYFRFLRTYSTRLWSSIS